jgi:hypothetical protein
MLLPILMDSHFGVPSFFRAVARAQDGYGGGAALLLLGVGVVLGAASGVPSWLLGLASIAALPALSIAELILDPASSSNLALSPIAWLFYVFFGSPVFLGAELVRRLAARKRSRIETGERLLGETPAAEQRDAADEAREG